jgi:hypothetical protein
MLLGGGQMRSLLLAMVMALVSTLVSTPASAQKSSIRFKFDFETIVTCSRPVNVTNFAARGSGAGVLNTDGSASFDLSLATSTVHFDARLGRSNPAPFGTSRLSVVNRHQLRAVWSLPNNDIIMNLSVTSDSCHASAVSQLRRGAREHNSVILGQLAYCGKLEITRTSCAVH